jgi:hypothetical protein
MSRRPPPRTPTHSRQSSRRANTKAEWDQLCEITAHRILRNGFVIEYLQAMTSVQLGGELGTGVVLIVSSGSKTVRNVRHTEPGISEGLTDMAHDGCELASVLIHLFRPYLKSYLEDNAGLFWFVRCLKAVCMGKGTTLTHRGPVDGRMILYGLAFHFAAAGS